MEKEKVGSWEALQLPCSRLTSFFCFLHFPFPSITLQKLKGGPSITAPNQPYSYIETISKPQQEAA